MYQVAIIPSTMGFYWEEVFAAYKVYIEQGWQIDFYTVNGQQPVADPTSIKSHPILSFVGLGVRKSFSPSSPLGTQLSNALAKSRAIDQLEVDAIDAIYIPGGHGCLFDVNINEMVHQKILEAYEGGKIISAVCHGSSALAFVKKNGKPIIAGKKIIGFLDSQDALLKKLGLINKKFLPLPYGNEAKIKEAGAKLSLVNQIFATLNPSYYVVDLPFVTGVGPKAARKVCEKVASLIQDKIFSS